MSDACCASEAGESEEQPTSFWGIREVRFAALSGALLVAGLAVSRSDRDAVATGLFLASLAAGAWTFVPETLKALINGRLGVGTLMTIAAVGAVVLGEYGEAASLAFLFSISEALESYALARTRRGLRALLDLVPERVTVRRGEEDIEFDPSELLVGDLMIVRPGERLATDGIVRTGRSTLDLSAITGESMPVEVVPATEVYAASINGTGVLEVEVTVLVSENSLARVVHIVEEAQERKGQSQRLSERIARPLVPGIMVIAGTIAVVGAIVGDPDVWVHRALVVLVAAAPCAFAISVPVTVVTAIGAATRMGILVKGGAALEALRNVRAVALDKTGTLTRNKPVVVDVVPTSTSQREQVLEVAAALEAQSEHPLAAAVLAAAPGVPPATDVQAVTGNGLVGSVGGRSARLGKPGFVDPQDLARDVDRLQSEGATVILVELDGSLIGAIAVRDELRPEASAVVEALHRLGMERVVMLTGDNRLTAESLGRQVGVDEVAAELLPEDKVSRMDGLKAYGRTAMVGDGVNDAPALASADVGIAMGAMGSDVAIETADVALMGEDLSHLPTVFAHARRAGRIMRQNLALSGTILIVLVPLAALGILGLATVVLAHELAEVVVIANGVRAGRRVSEPVVPRPVPNPSSTAPGAREPATLPRRG